MDKKELGFTDIIGSKIQNVENLMPILERVLTDLFFLKTYLVLNHEYGKKAGYFTITDSNNFRNRIVSRFLAEFTEIFFKNVLILNKNNKEKFSELFNTAARAREEDQFGELNENALFTSYEEIFKKYIQVDEDSIKKERKKPLDEELEKKVISYFSISKSNIRYYLTSFFLSDAILTRLGNSMLFIELLDFAFTDNDKKAKNEIDKNVIKRLIDKYNPPIIFQRAVFLKEDYKFLEINDWLVKAGAELKNYDYINSACIELERFSQLYVEKYGLIIFIPSFATSDSASTEIEWARKKHIDLKVFYESDLYEMALLSIRGREYVRRYIIKRLY